MIELPILLRGVKSRSGILKNQLDLTVIIFSQCGIGKVQRLAVEAYRTTVSRRQPHKQTCQGAFAAAACPSQPQTFAGGDSKADIADSRQCVMFTEESFAEVECL